MNTNTQEFQAVESYQPTQPQDARRSRAVTVIVVIAAMLLTAAAVLVVGQLLYGTGTATVEASPAPVATNPEPAEQEPATEAPAVTEPDPEPAQTPSAPPANNNGHEGPSSDPVEPPVPSEPETYTHPLEGTVWDVVAINNGVTGMIDVHPLYAHQIEFDDGRVYTKGLNGGSAEYAITGNEYGWGYGFHVGMLMTTMMGGPAEALAQDAMVHSALQNAEFYELHGEYLYIVDGAGIALLILEVVPGC